MYNIRNITIADEHFVVVSHWSDEFMGISLSSLIIAISLVVVLPVVIALGKMFKN